MRFNEQETKMMKILLLLLLLSIPVSSVYTAPLHDLHHDNNSVVKNTILISSTADGKYAVSHPSPDTKKRNASARHTLLSKVAHWFYYLGFNPDEKTIQQIEDSTYDMIVMEPIFTEEENTDFPISNVVTRLHSAAHPKLVIAYIDIGQAEEWRTYWQKGWGIGNPSWIVADDPDGWEGNYPVKYWDTDWKNIWLGSSGYLQQLIDAGFDGIYLDWVEAYSDENVLSAAAADEIDSREEMITWVGELAAFGRTQNPNFIVIGQNAAELALQENYLEIIDAVAQEQVWFDGAADNTPPGDCPLPSTDEDIDTGAYEDSLKAIDNTLNQTDDGCYGMYKDFPESTLHVSSEWYLNYLSPAREKGKMIFTIDYAAIPENVDRIYDRSRALGFVPYVSERLLDIFIEPVPYKNKPSECPDICTPSELQAQYEAGKKYCMDNPGACGISVGEGYTKQDVDDARQSGYDEGYLAGQNNANPSGNCALLYENLDINMPCIDVFGTNIPITLERYIPTEDPSGYYWKLNLE